MARIVFPALLIVALAAPAVAAEPIPARAAAKRTDPAARRIPERAAADAAEEPDRVMPGRFGTDATEIPGQFLKGRTVEPKKPDVSVPVGKRTTIGVFQESGRIDPHVTAPWKQNRDLGAGFTLQHRFGGP